MKIEEALENVGPTTIEMDEKNLEGINQSYLACGGAIGEVIFMSSRVISALFKEEGIDTDHRFMISEQNLEKFKHGVAMGISATDPQDVEGGFIVGIEGGAPLALLYVLGEALRDLAEHVLKTNNMELPRRNYEN